MTRDNMEKPVPGVQSSLVPAPSDPTSGPPTTTDDNVYTAVDLSSEPADAQTPPSWETTPEISRKRTIGDMRHWVTVVMMSLLGLVIVGALTDAMFFHPDSRNVRDLVTTLVALVGPVIGFYYAKRKTD